MCLTIKEGALSGGGVGTTGHLQGQKWNAAHVVHARQVCLDYDQVLTNYVGSAGTQRAG